MIIEDIGNKAVDNAVNNAVDNAVDDREYYEEDEIFENKNKKDFMKKMSKKQMKKFPKVVDYSIICQSHYIARFEKCTGCDLAVPGCEKVFAMGCN